MWHDAAAICRPGLERLLDAVRRFGPGLLFGFRLWASVCLALYVAFWLQLDDAYWAGTSAALVCQPQLGASLRKGWFRILGTLVGAVAIVILSACFAQDRGTFLIFLALLAAASAFAATLLRNFASYAAALAGYTAVIVASDTLGATGGTDGQAFMLAIDRTTEICVGIVSAGLVLAGTDFGGARRHLAGLVATLAADVTTGFLDTLPEPELTAPASKRERRALIGRVAALDPVIDQAIGESATLRYHSPMLRSAVDSLFAALSAWRAVATSLLLLPEDEARQEAGLILEKLPPELEPGQGARWLDDPLRWRALCTAASDRLMAMPARTPARRMLLDQTARLLASIADALDGLALLTGDPVRLQRRHPARLHVPDWLPALVNAGRGFVAIGLMELFWIASEWPNGALAITWTAIPVILLAPRADQAYASAVDFALGTALAAMFAALMLFAVLPSLETFVGFGAALGAYLVPAGALMAQAWRPALFAPMTGNFTPLLAPANQMTYDTVQFYNAALAVFAGSAVAAVSFRLIPPLSPAFRTRRLLALTRRDLRRVALARVQPTLHEWEGRVYARLVSLPDEAEPLQRARLLAALSAGTELLRLRQVGAQLGLGPDLEAMLRALARGDGAGANARLARLDHRLALQAEDTPGKPVTMRARATVLALSEVIAEHAAYFGGVSR